MSNPYRMPASRPVSARPSRLLALTTNGSGPIRQTTRGNRRTRSASSWTSSGAFMGSALLDLLAQRAEDLDLDGVLGPGAGSLHADEVVDRGDEDADALQIDARGGARQLVVAGHPGGRPE